MAWRSRIAARAGLALVVASGCDPTGTSSGGVSSSASTSSSASPSSAPSSSRSSTSAPSASTSSSLPAEEPTDEELEKILQDRVAAHKVQAARRLCLYRNQRVDAPPCPPDPKVSPHAIDKTFRERLAEITDPARKKAWQKAWERASSEGIVDRPTAAPRP